MKVRYNLVAKVSDSNGREDFVLTCIDSHCCYINLLKVVRVEPCTLVLYQVTHIQTHHTLVVPWAQLPALILAYRPACEQGLSHFGNQCGWDYMSLISFPSI